MIGESSATPSARHERTAVENEPRMKDGKRRGTLNRSNKTLCNQILNLTTCSNSTLHGVKAKGYMGVYIVLSGFKKIGQKEPSP